MSDHTASPDVPGPERAEEVTRVGAPNMNQLVVALERIRDNGVNGAAWCSAVAEEVLRGVTGDRPATNGDRVVADDHPQSMDAGERPAPVETETSPSADALARAIHPSGWREWGIGALANLAEAHRTDSLDVDATEAGGDVDYAAARAARQKRAEAAEARIAELEQEREKWKLESARDRSLSKQALAAAAAEIERLRTALSTEANRDPKCVGWYRQMALRFAEDRHELKMRYREAMAEIQALKDQR